MQLRETSDKLADVSFDGPSVMSSSQLTILSSLRTDSDSVQNTACCLLSKYPATALQSKSFLSWLYGAKMYMRR